MAWSLGAESFEIGGRFVYYSGNGIHWWNEIDHSEEWQRGIFYFLSASYALISIIALVCFPFLFFFNFFFLFVTFWSFHELNCCRILFISKGLFLPKCV